GGWGWTTDKRAFSTTNAVNGLGAFVGLDPSALDLKSNSPLFGAQVGFNWQVDPSWVLGIEGDITGTRLKSAATANPLCNTAWCGVPTPAPTGALTVMQRDINWLASVRGRLGYAWGPSMIYVTGGVAWTNVHHAANTGDGLVVCEEAPSCAYPAS